MFQLLIKTSPGKESEPGSTLMFRIFESIAEILAGTYETLNKKYSYYDAWYKAYTNNS
jgi:hypothetical protein